jgi:hypothetical protein
MITSLPKEQKVQVCDATKTSLKNKTPPHKKSLLKFA